MKYRWLIVVAVLAAAMGIVFVAVWLGSQPVPPPGESTYMVEVAFTNLTFDRPVGIYSSGDGTGRLFVLEQRGVIYVFDNHRDTTAATVFLDIQDRVNSAGSEEGLLGLAFHPDFVDNGFFFVDYTASDPRRTVISRYSVVSGDPNQADKASGHVLLEVLQPYSNHNGGQLAFGSDSYLYIAMGDGGSAGDPHGNGQNRTALLGKILRVDVDRMSGDLNYGIPSDNPFVGNTVGYREEIYAYGFRNPWRFSFDPVTGWLWAADVGQDQVEEVDIVDKGGNYGWNIMEGNICFQPSAGCNQTGLSMPIWTYSHSLGYSVTGGFVYRGFVHPELVGSYIYADFGSGRVWSLSFDGVNQTANKELVDSDLSVTSLGVDEQNELYICSLDGKIYRLTKA
jgi:glucose/arabinose dehydrogenase